MIKESVNLSLVKTMNITTMIFLNREFETAEKIKGRTRFHILAKL